MTAAIVLVRRNKESRDAVRANNPGAESSMPADDVATMSIGTGGPGTRRIMRLVVGRRENARSHVLCGFGTMRAQATVATAGASSVVPTAVSAGRHVVSALGAAM